MLLEQMRDALAALHETEGVGWETIKAIMAQDGLKEADKRRPADWRALGMSARRAEAIARSLEPSQMARRRARWARSGLNVVTALDPEYPERLRQIFKPPWVFYCIGRLALLAKPQIAVVGTRQATAYGKRAAEDLSASFSHAGLTVTSGMAKGIDAAAHTGALRGRGSTIAVLGSPADVVYPPENRALYRRIAEDGLILSLTPPDVPIHPGMFPMRNRIIAGLSLGVVVVEAAARSGALLTAIEATKENRDVYAVPGPISSPRSRGALELIRDGATQVLDAEDVIKHYRHYLDGVLIPGMPSWNEPQLSADEAKIYRLLEEGPASAEELCHRSGLTFGLLHAVLISLQIKQRIHQQPGSVYIAL
ncbi:DNA-processing protein DprA [Cohnella sp. 56]|uniref:DNA-processing protein DprA n=1 Tax=Cohnella sp. 56 TaxID=3113722 RepID=UPI0030E95FE0